MRSSNEQILRFHFYLQSHWALIPMMSYGLTPSSIRLQSAQGHSRHSQSHLHFYATWSCKWPNLIWQQVNIGCAAWASRRDNFLQHLPYKAATEASRKQGCLMHTHQLHISPTLFYPFCNPGKKKPHFSFSWWTCRKWESGAWEGKPRELDSADLLAFLALIRVLQHKEKNAFILIVKGDSVSPAPWYNKELLVFRAIRSSSRTGFGLPLEEARKEADFFQRQGASEHDHVETNTKYSGSFLARTSSSL